MKKLLFFIAILFAGYVAMAQCNPSFTYSQAAGNSLLNIAFTNTTNTGTLPPYQSASYSFNYGDGTPAGYGQHTYAAAGNYTVTINMKITYLDTIAGTIIDTLVCSGADSMVINVGNTTCGSTISSTVTATAPTSETISFSANTPSGTNGVTYLWNFGDGNTDTGATISHTYTSGGSFMITLTTTNGGCTSTSYVYEDVYLLNCDLMSANFTYATSYNNVSFNNTSTTNDVFNHVYTWDFGDGTVGSTADNPAHNYASTGTYNVTLTTNWSDDTISANLQCTKTVTLPVIVGTPPNIISGMISYSGSTTDSNTFQVWLIQKNGNILSAVDSMRIYTSSYEFNNKPSGTYMVKAESIVASSPSTTGYLPTYATSSLYWDSALNVNHTGGDDENVNIVLQQGIATSGPGFVAGNVLSGANKGTTDGIPVVGLQIYLRNAGTNVITYQYTDANGNYSFSNLPVGNYSTYPEAEGYQTTPYNFSISAGQPSVSGINYRQHTVSMTITPVTTGVSNVTAGETKLDVYPNPNNGQMNINWQTATKQNAHISITDVIGRKVYETDMTLQPGTGNTKLDVSELKDGLYLMSVKSENINSSQKVVIQH